MAIQDGVTPLNAANLVHRTGDDTITGHHSYTKPVGTAGGVNYLRGGDFENWFGNIPEGWTLNGAGASVAKDGTNFKIGALAAALTRAGADCYLSQRVDLIALGPAAFWGSKKVTLGAWVRATVAGRARLAVNDGTTTTLSTYHTGGSSWEFLTVTATLQATPTAVEARLQVDSGNTTAQFDGAVFVLGALIQDFIPSAPLMPLVNFAFNSDMEIWGAGAATAPTRWILNGAGATVARDTTNFRFGSRSAALTRVGTDCYLAQDIATIADFGPAAAWQGRRVTLGVLVRATVAAVAMVEINDGVGTSTSAAHPGGGAWEVLTVSRLIDSAATKVEIRLSVKTSNATAQFDGIALVEGGTMPMAFIPSGWRGRNASFWGGNVSANTAGTYFFAPPGGSVTETLISFPVPFKCVARNLHLSGNVAPATSHRAVLRRSETTDTALDTAAVGTRAAADVTNEVELAKGELISFKYVLVGGTSVAAHISCELEEIP